MLDFNSATNLTFALNPVEGIVTGSQVKTPPAVIVILLSGGFSI